MKVITLIGDASVCERSLGTWTSDRSAGEMSAVDDSRGEPDWVYGPVDDGWPGWSADLPADLFRDHPALSRALSSAFFPAVRAVRPCGDRNSTFLERLLKARTVPL